MSHPEPRIIGLVGLPGAGKTTVATYLQTKGFACVTLSDFIRDEAQQRGVTSITRETLQEYGNQMRQAFGPHILAARAMKKVKALGGQVVVDGIRNMHEVTFLRQQPHFMLMAVVASQEVRFRRLTRRTDRPFGGTYEDFLRLENREDALGPVDTGLRVADCIDQADVRVENADSLERLYVLIDAIVSKN